MDASSKEGQGVRQFRGRLLVIRVAIRDRCDKAVAAGIERLDEAGIVRRITQGLSQFSDGRIQTLIKARETILRPQSLSQFPAGDNFAGALE